MRRSRSLRAWLPLMVLVVAMVATAAAPSVLAAPPEALLRGAALSLDAAQQANRNAQARCRGRIGAEIERAQTGLARVRGFDADRLQAIRADLGALAYDVDQNCPAPLRAAMAREVVRALARIEIMLEDGGSGVPAGPPLVAVIATQSSVVDPSCLAALRAAYPYVADLATIVEWLGVCRSGPAAGNCDQAASRPDTQCMEAATKLYPYQIDARTQATLFEGCTRSECRLAPEVRAVERRVDAACFEQLAKGYAYQPSRDQIVKWAESCRARDNLPRCAITGGHFDGGCFAVAKSHYPYQFDRAALKAFAAACQVEEFACEER